MHAGTIEAARRFAGQKPGVRIYGKTRMLPDGTRTWVRFAKQGAKS